MGTFLQDLRYSIRVLLRNRFYAFVAVLSMALGIGANTAVFSAINSVLIKSLPFAEIDRLVVVWGTSKNEENLNDRNQISSTDIADVRKQNTVFKSITTFTGWMPILSGFGEAERLPAIQVGDNYFDVMKGKPLLGRVFLPEEQQEGKDFVIVLGHGLWKRKFGGDPFVVGKKILLNGSS